MDITGTIYPKTDKVISIRVPRHSGPNCGPDVPREVKELARDGGYSTIYDADDKVDSGLVRFDAEFCVVFFRVAAENATAMNAAITKHKIEKITTSKEAAIKEEFLRFESTKNDLITNIANGG
jgi:hypothetical protein